MGPDPQIKGQISGKNRASQWSELGECGIGCAKKYSLDAAASQIYLGISRFSERRLSQKISRTCGERDLV